MNTFFTADTHFGHANIIRYCKRPWILPSDLDEDGNWAVDKEVVHLRAKAMDNDLINIWNLTVTNEDTVFFLGDFCMGSAGKYLNRLNFKNFYFVMGNHDKDLCLFERYTQRVTPLGKRHTVKNFGNLSEVIVEGQSIILCHYAMRVWSMSHHGSWHLFGHSHGTLPDDPRSKSLDVGVDVHNYRPIDFHEVSTYMSKKD